MEWLNSCIEGVKCDVGMSVASLSRLLKERETLLAQSK
jgi:hypothetical protein